MAILDRILRYLFGHDVFISYSRYDAFDYAGALAFSLNRDGYNAFVDQVGTPPQQIWGRFNLTPFLPWKIIH
jgi:hypothetical protein